MAKSETRLTVGSVVELHESLYRFSDNCPQGHVTVVYANGNVRVRLYGSGRVLRSVNPCYLTATGDTYREHSVAPKTGKRLDGRYVGRDWERRDELGRAGWTIWGPYYPDRWEAGERGAPFAKSGRYYTREQAREALRRLRADESQ